MRGGPSFMKYNLIFDQRFLVSFNDNRLIAQHPISIYVPMIFNIWRRFPKASRVHAAAIRRSDCATVKKIFFVTNELRCRKVWKQKCLPLPWHQYNVSQQSGEDHHDYEQNDVDESTGASHVKSLCVSILIDDVFLSVLWLELTT